MITRMKLQNFKCHESLELNDIPPISVFIGRNNTGKSSFLHAAAYPKYGQRYDPALPIGRGADIPRPPAKEAQVEMTYDNRVRYSYLVSVERLSQRWEGPQNIEVLQSVFYLSALRVASENFRYQRFTRDVGAGGENAYNMLHQLKANDDPRYETILDWLRSMSLGVSSIGTPTVVDGNAGAIEPTTYGTRTNILLHGGGTWSVLPIVVQGVVCERGETMLIEEPESHLHRAAINDLWLFFADCAGRGVQVMCTTHSLDFLVSLSERMRDGKVPSNSAIYHLRRDGAGTTSVKTWDPELFRNISQEIKKDLAVD